MRRIASAGDGATHKAIEPARQIGNGKRIMTAPTMFFEAIALQKCLMATYNKMVVKLAPHILYTRHDEMFIDAVTIERDGRPPRELRSEEHTSELQSLMRISYAVFCLKKKKTHKSHTEQTSNTKLNKSRRRTQIN